MKNGKLKEGLDDCKDKSVSLSFRLTIAYASYIDIEGCCEDGTIPKVVMTHTQLSNAPMANRIHTIQQHPAFILQANLHLPKYPTELSFGEIQITILDFPNA